MSENVHVKINRFDSELYQILGSSPDSVVDGAFKQKYAEFLPLYIQGVLRTPMQNGDPMFLLRSFFKDSTLKVLYTFEQNKFVNLEKEEAQLSNAMSLYKTWFPKDQIPEFSMHVSGLSQSVITTEKLVSISGDKYLGDDFPLYKSYFYSYQLSLMAPDNMVCDAVKAFLQGHYPEVSSDILLDKMIYQGVIAAAAAELLDEEKEARVLGFTDAEFDWLTKNEKGVWVFMVENEQLYSTDVMTTAKYMEEAPFTSFFWQNSPSRIGRYIGYKIVRSYLKKHDQSASVLLGRFDSHNVLSDSGYRP